MNKIWLMGAAVCMIVAFGSCKPKQSAYKAAYEQAKEKESTAPVEGVEETEEVVDMITSELGGELEKENVDSEEMFNSLEIDTTDYEEHGRTADVYADISFELAGEPMERYGVFHMEQVNEQWYISSFEFTADTAR